MLVHSMRAKSSRLAGGKAVTLDTGLALMHDPRKPCSVFGSCAKRERGRSTFACYIPDSAAISALAFS
jgi:hypothetical protein